MMGYHFLMLTLAASVCARLPATDLVVPDNLDFASHTTADSFIQAMTKSGGTEADCRSFATTTIASIKAEVTSVQGVLTAVDTGSGCAKEGQTLVSSTRVTLDSSCGEDGCSSMGQCQGDCDDDDDCAGDLGCFQRDGLDPVPGCSGEGVDNYDYCTSSDGNDDLVAKQDKAASALSTKNTACSASVAFAVNLDTLQAKTCYDYTSEATYISAMAECGSATTALTKADQAVTTATTAVSDARPTYDAAVAEAARLKSACHCRVQREQATAWTAASPAAAAHVADWKQAHEVICALNKNSKCTVPTCPAVTQPAAASGVDAEDCSQDASSGCSDPKANTRYAPVDNVDGGRKRTVTASNQACADRCAATSGCAHWSRWAIDGGCHLSSSESSRSNANGVSSGSCTPTITYYQGKAGTICPSGQRITSKDECINTAVNSLGVQIGNTWIGSINSIPVGCSIWIDSNPAIPAIPHWNTHSDGRGRSNLNPVCKAAM